MDRCMDHADSRVTKDARDIALFPFHKKVLKVLKHDYII